MHQCEKLYEQQSWLGSQLGLLHQFFSGKYLVVGFYIWVMYGSWSKCGDSGSFFFDDFC